MIQVKNLVKSFNGLSVLKSINLSVNSTEIHGIVGPNGAGKTTLFKIICKLISADDGTVDITSSKKKQIGAIIENPAAYEYLSASDNIRVFGTAQGLDIQKTDIKILLNKVGLSPTRKDPVKNYSLGMKQRLGIALTLLNDPDILVLDEPFLGLDPLGMADLQSLILQLAKEENKAVIISSHLLNTLSNICDYLYILKEGSFICSGNTKEVMEQFILNYTITGDNLTQSKALEHIEYNGDDKKISFSITDKEANALLLKMLNEGVQISSFEPETDLNKLYSN